MTGRAAAGLVLLGALLLYLPFSGNPLLFDDRQFLAANWYVTEAAGPLDPFLHDYWYPENPSGLYRPLAVLLYAGEARLFGDFLPAYRLAGTLLHAANALLLAALVLALGGGPILAWAAAALFAVHAAHAEVAATAVGQAESAAALFAQLALLAFQRGSRGGRCAPGWFLAAGAAFLAGLFFKETVLVLPAACWLARRLAPAPRAPDGRECSPVDYAPLLAAALAYFTLRQQVVPFGPGEEGQALAGLPLGLRLAFPPVLAARYLLQLAFPLPSYPDYDHLLREARECAFGLETALALPLLAAAAAGLWALRRRPGLLLAGIAAPLALAPALNVLPIGVVFAPRLLYLPSLAACVLAASPFAALLARRRALGGILLALLLAAHAGIAAATARSWRSDAALWSELVRDHPLTRHGRRGLGGQFLAAGDERRAAAQFAAGRRAHPDRAAFPGDQAALAAAAWRRTRDPARLAAARARLGESLRLRPDYLPALRLAGNLAAEEGLAAGDARLLEDALGWYRRALAIRPPDPDTLARLAALELELGRPEAAQAALERALRLHPRHLPALTCLAELLRRRGDPAAVPLARLLADRAAARGPAAAADDEVVAARLAAWQAEAALGGPAGKLRAVWLLEELLAVRQGDAPLRYNRALLLLELDRAPEAETELRAAWGFNASFAPPCLYLARLARAGGRLDEARQWLRRGLAAPVCPPEIRAALAEEERALGKE